jgi:hypothetical protein
MKKNKILLIPTDFKDIHFYDIHDLIVLIGFEGMKEAVIMVRGGGCGMD